MASERSTTDQSSMSRRLKLDPVQLWQRSRTGVALAIVVHFVATAGWIPGAAIFYWLTWLALPLLALALGYGTAILLRHGLGRRRVIAQLVTGVILAQIGIIILSIVRFPSDRVASDAVVGLVNLARYVGLLITLAALFGLLLGRALPAVGQRLKGYLERDW